MNTDISHSARITPGIPLDIDAAELRGAKYELHRLLPDPTYDEINHRKQHGSKYDMRDNDLETVQPKCDRLNNVRRGSVSHFEPGAKSVIAIGVGSF